MLSFLHSNIKNYRPYFFIIAVEQLCNLTINHIIIPAISSLMFYTMFYVIYVTSYIIYAMEKQLGLQNLNLMQSNILNCPSQRG